MKLESLVKVIQTAALAASDALHSKNLQLLDTFFDFIDETEVKSDIKESLLKSDISELDEEKIDEIISNLPTELLQNIKQSGSKMIPKMVSVHYPRETSNGPVSHEVRVPLITLVPLSVNEISNVKFKTQLEVKDIEDELHISFPNNGADADDVTIASLEINVDKALPPEGLKKLIEGYERALRAQIPG